MSQILVIAGGVRIRHACLMHVWAALTPFCGCAVHAHPMPTDVYAPGCCTWTKSEYISAKVNDQAPALRREPLCVAANVHPRNPGVGGVIDRSVPKSNTPTTSSEAGLTQFNRVPDATFAAGRSPTAGLGVPAAIPEPDDGALYTVLERPVGSIQQVRPVGFSQPHARPATGTSSPRRYCTVNEVLRSTAQSCR
jgi:hypothetical protein